MTETQDNSGAKNWRTFPSLANSVCQPISPETQTSRGLNRRAELQGIKSHGPSQLGVGNITFLLSGRFGYVKLLESNYF